jgi:hypothetical protein
MELFEECYFGLPASFGPLLPRAGNGPAVLAAGAVLFWDPSKHTGIQLNRRLLLRHQFHALSSTHRIFCHPNPPRQSRQVA